MLGSDAYCTNEERDGKPMRLVNMFHSVTDEESKEEIQQSLQAEDGACSVVVCTSALGMGINMKGVRTVVNIGSPDTAEEYLQAIGRAGRDGADSFAVLLHSPSLSRGIGADMKKFIRLSSGCRRQVFLSFSDYTPDATQRPHKSQGRTNVAICVEDHAHVIRTCSSGKLT